MADRAEEWFFQADYDLDTARYMLDGGRRFYAVFMAHLAVEKALRGVYQHRLKVAPPKTHDLLLLIEGLWDRIKWMAPAIGEAHAPMDVIPMTPEEWAEGGMIQDIAANGEDV